MSAENLDFYLNNQEAYDALSIEQIHALGRGETVEYGETEPAQADEESSEAPAAAETKEEPEAKPEVLARDGKHTIPYSELEAARNRASELEALANEQSSLIAELKAAKEADKGTGTTDAQDEVMENFKEVYPELAEMLAPVVQKMIDSGVNARVDALEKRFSEALAPIQKAAQDSSTDAHFSKIRGAHSDLDAIVDSGDLVSWVEKLPSYARAGAANVLKAGSAEAVIELLDQYKAATGKPAAAPADAKEQIAAKAAEAIAKAKKPSITSLSDIPASSGTEANEEPTTVQGWSKKFAGMTPAQIQKELAR